MRQNELLGRLVNGAELRIVRDPWGRLLPSVALVEDGAPGKVDIVHCWQIRKMMDAGLLVYDGGTVENSSLFLLTAAGRALGSNWVRVRPKGTADGEEQP